MNIPKSLKIGGKVYTVEITDNISLGCDYTGEILYNDLKINIRPSARAKMEADFIHELIHGIFVNLGYYDHDEKKVEELAEVLYAVFVDNPEMFSAEAATDEARGLPKNLFRSCDTCDKKGWGMPECKDCNRDNGYKWYQEKRATQ